MNKTGSKTLHGMLLATSAMVASPVIVSTAAMANPAGGSVAVGSATIANPSATQTVINQSSKRALINWNSFNIQSGASVTFNQPNSKSLTVNRVTGPGSSTIDGSLFANGNIWLLNTNGILFGKGSQINVGSILATTSELSDSDFATGNNNFTASPNPNASVINQGTITASRGGSVVLSAPTVSNEGMIQADLGTVVLGGAQAFTVDMTGDNLLRYEIAAPVTQTPTNGQGSPALALVSNSGTIAANGGHVVMTARAAQNVQDNVINNTGMVEATSVSVHNGEVDFDAGPNGTADIGGTVDVSGSGKGQTGGTVTATGGTVNVASGAMINASGNAGGGMVMIGGGPHGTGTLAHAQRTVIGAGSTINADATGNGNGGDVTIWSDGTTQFGGAITSRGGAFGGNGGQVETSGHNLGVGASAKVDTSAPLGLTGDWLLDPANITIASAGGEGIGSHSICVTISNATIKAALSSSNVTLEAASNINVSTNASISWSSDNALSLLSEGNISIRSSIQSEGDGALNIIAGWDGTTGVSGSYSGLQPVNVTAIGANRAFGDSCGSISINSSVAIGARTGVTTIAADDILLGSCGTVNVQLGYTGGGGGNIIIDTKGNFTIGGDANSNYLLGNGGIDSCVSAPVTGDVSLDIGGNLSVSVSGCGTANIGDGAIYGTLGSTTSGDVSINVAGATTLNNSSCGTISIGTANSGNVTITTGSLSETGKILENSIFADLGRGNVTFGDGSDYQLNTGSGANYSSSNNLELLSKGNLTIDTSIQNSGSGNITLVSGWDGTLTTFSPSIPSAWNGGGNIMIGDEGGAVAVGSAAGATSLYGGNITVHAAEGVDQGYAQVGYLGSATGAISIDATGALDLTAGNTPNAGQYAQIGHGLEGLVGDDSGDITIVAGSVVLQGGANASSVAQIGHGGQTAGNLTGNISVTATSGDIELTTGDEGYALIGHSGGNVTTITSGNITVTSDAGNITLKGSDGLFGVAQIGDASIATETGTITVQSARNLTLTGGSGGAAQAQIGSSAGNITQDINVTVGGNLALTGANSGSGGSAQIGNGDVGRLYSNATGPDASGNITVNVVGATIIASSVTQNDAWIGNIPQADSAGTGTTTIITGGLDTTGDTLGDTANMLGHDLVNGNVSVTYTNQTNTDLGFINYTSANNLTIIGAGDLNLTDGITNCGTGSISISAGNTLGSTSGNLTITGAVTVIGTTVSLTAPGDITQGHNSGLDGGDFTVDSTAGNVTLLNGNEMDGTVNISAFGDAAFGNNDNTTLGKTSVGGNVTVLSTGNLNVTSDIGTNGNIELVAGWDGNAAPSQITASANTTWGQNNGTVTIGGPGVLRNGGNAHDVVVGSVHGTTSIYGYDVTVSAAEGYFSQLGHYSGGNGTIAVNALHDISVTSNSGEGADSVALIGNGNPFATGTVGGNITLNAGHNVTLSTGESTFAAIGNYGDGASVTGEINITAGGNISLTAGNNDLGCIGGCFESEQTGAVIGNNGQSSIGTVGGNITLSAGQDVLLYGEGLFAGIGNTGSGVQVSGNINITAGGKVMLTSADSVQIGNTGNAVSGTLGGNITVSAAADILVISQAEGAVAQIGNGGFAHNGAIGGNINVTSGGSMLISGKGDDNSYALIGNGDPTGQSTGSVSGDINLNIPEVLNFDGENGGKAWLGNIGGTNDGDIESGNLTVTFGSENDEGSAYFGDMIVADLGSSSEAGSGGNVFVGSISSAGNVGGFFYDSPNTLSIAAVDGLDVSKSIQNSGSGAINIIGGWDGVTYTPSALGNAGVYGNTFGDVYIAGSGISVGSAGGPTLVAGANITLNDAGGSAQIGYNGSSSSAITVLASDNVVVEASSAGNIVQIGNGGAGVTGAVGGDITVKAGGTVMIEASGQGSAANIGNLGGSGSSQSGNITVTATGALTVEAENTNANAQIGNLEVDLSGTPANLGDAGGNINVTAASVDLDADSGGASAQIGNGDTQYYNNNVTGSITINTGDLTLNSYGTTDTSVPDPLSFARIGDRANGNDTSNITIHAGEVNVFAINNGNAIIGQGADNGIASGDIDVVSSGNVSLYTVGTDGQTRIGNAGTAGANGNVTVVAAGNISLQAYGSDDVAKIVNFGEGVSGNISVTSTGGNITLIASGEGALARIGFEGDGLTYPVSGNVTVTANSTLPDAGSITLDSGGESRAQIGNLGYNGPSVGGNISVTAANTLTLDGTDTVIGNIESDGTAGSGAINITVSAFDLQSAAEVAGDSADIVVTDAGNGIGSTYTPLVIALNDLAIQTDNGDVYVWSTKPGFSVGVGSNGIDIGSGSLFLSTTDGDITQTHAITAAYADIVSTNGNISLTDAQNSIASLQFDAGQNATIGDSGDVDFQGGSSGGDATLLTTGNLTVDGSLQNAGSGNVTLVAGWDGHTVAPSSLTDTGVYGNSNGSVTVDSDFSVGSLAGQTTVEGDNVVLNATNGTAQIGYAGLGSGDILVNAKDAVELDGGIYSFTEAQIGSGYGLYSPSGGDITVNAGSVSVNGTNAILGNSVTFTTTGGDIGSTTAPVSVAVGGLAIQTNNGSAYISSPNQGLSIGVGSNGVNVGSGWFVLGAGSGDITQTQAVTAGYADFVTQSGNILLTDAQNSIASLAFDAGQGATIANSGDLDLLGGSSGDDATLLTTGNLTVDGSLQNGSSNVTLVAGWDGHTSDPESLANAVVYGNNGGNVTINGAGEFGTSVGSQYGATLVEGHDINLEAGTSSAQIGWQGPSGNGNITVQATGNVTLAGGVLGTCDDECTESYAQIGNGGVSSNGSSSGFITVQAGGNISLQAGAGTYDYAQIGNGGDTGSENTSGDISVAAGGSIALTGSTDYTQIGDGGYGAQSANSNITVQAQNISLTSGPSGQWGYAQIGNGGITGSGSFYGDINVTANGTIAMTAGENGQYAQIGNGADLDTASYSYGSGDINIQAGALILTGAHSAGDGDSYVEIGNTGTNGNANGNISVTASGNLTIATTEGGGNVWIGNTAPNGSAGGEVSIIAGDIAGDGDNNNDGQKFINADLEGGDLTLGITDPTAHNAVGGFIYSSSYDLTLLTAGSMTVEDDIQNSGSGNITVVTGWNPSVAPANVSSTAGAYGNGNSTLTIGGSEGHAFASLGSASGTTNVFTGNLFVDAYNGRAQLGYRGDGSGAINVNALGGVDVETDTGNIAQIGNGGLFATYAQGEISINAQTVEVTSAADNSIAQIGNIGGADSSQSGDITINAPGAVSVVALGTNSTAQIGNSEDASSDPGVYGYAYGGIQINTGTLSLFTAAGDASAQIGDGSELGYDSYVYGSVSVSANQVDIASAGVDSGTADSEARVGSRASEDTFGSVTVNVTGALQMDASTAGNAIIGDHADSGTYGSLAVNAGTITADAEGPGSQIFVGHSGSSAYSDVDVAASGDIRLTASGANTLVDIGNAVTGYASGNVTVTSQTGNISAVSAGEGSFAGIGLTAETDSAYANGNVTVTGNNVNVIASGNNTLANIGVVSEGGYASGNVTVTGNNVNIIASGNNTLANIGAVSEGGYADGNVTVTGNNVNVIASGNDTLANIGVVSEGGYANGDVTVTAAQNLTLSSSESGLANIGAQGLGEGYATAAINMTANALSTSGNALVSGESATIVLTGAGNSVGTSDAPLTVAVYELAIQTDNGDAYISSPSQGLALGVGTDGVNLGTGNLTVSANGGIYQNAAIEASALNLTVSSGEISLTNAGNTFNTATLVSPNNAYLTDSTALTVVSANVTDTFSLTATSINQTGAIDADWLNAIATNGSIALTNANNAFNIALLTASGDASLTDSTDLSVGATVGGNLTLAATTINEFGTITADGLNVTTSNGDISLTSGENAFNTVSLSSAQDAYLTDSTALTVTGATAGGYLSLTGASIAQTGAISATNLSATATNGNIVLTNAGNSFGEASLLSSGDASLIDSTGVTIDGANVTGNLTLTAQSINQTGAIDAGTLTATASNGGILLTNTNNAIGTASLSSSADTSLSDSTALTIAGATVGSNLTLAAASISQTGAMHATNLAATSSNGSIALTNTGNNVTNASLTSSADASLTDSTGVTLTGGHVTGNLTLTALSIGQTGAVRANALTATASNGGILLTNTGNAIGTASLSSSADTALTDSTALIIAGATVGSNLTLTAASFTQTGAIHATNLSVGASNGSIALTNANNTIANALLNASGDASLTDSGNLTVTGATAGGNLTLAAASIGQSGAINGKALTATASNGNIVLINTGNNVTAASLTSTGDASLTDSTGVTLAGGHVTGNLTLAATSISESGAVSANTLTATASNGSIALTNTGNNITSASLTASGDAALSDASALTISGATAGGNLTLAAASIAQSSAIHANALTATASNGSIALTNTGNNITVASLTASGGASLTDASALTISGATTGGNLTLAAASIGQTGAIKTNALTVTASNGSIALTNTGNNVTAASLTSTGDASLYDVASLTLNQANVGGNLTLLTEGNLVFASSAQLTNGALLAVAGWDGTTTSPSALTSGSAYGNHGGNITIGGGSSGVAVGSQSGTTTLAADDLVLSAINGYAQVGYHGGGSGAIAVNTTGDVTLNGGAGTAYFAQIGDGGYKVSGSNSGAVSVLANGNVTLNAGSGQEAYAQIGNGGAESNSSSTGYTNTGAIAVQGKAVALNAGSGSASYAQIGDGGYKSGQSLNGTATIGNDIMIAAVSGVTLSGNAADAYAQIGNGGDFVNAGSANGSGGTIGGNITVAVSAPTVAGNAIVATAGSGANSYAQVGNGGNGENTTGSGNTVTFNVSGNVTLNDLALTGSNTGSDGYAQVGNGDAAHTGNGNVAGNIVISQGTIIDLTPGTAPGASTGIQNATGTGTVTGSVTGYQATTPTSDPTTAGSVSSIIQNNTTPTSITFTATNPAPPVNGSGSDFTTGGSISSAPTPLEKLAGEAEDEDTPSDGAANSIGNSLNGNGKSRTVSKTIIPGVLDEIITVTPTHPHGVPPADVDYSSWGNEALWRW